MSNLISSTKNHKVIELSAQQGFLLTRQSFDRQGSTQINLWVSTADGPVRLIITDEKPVFFLKQSDLKQLDLLAVAQHNNYTYKTLSLKTFSQQAVAAVYSNTLRSFYDFREVLIKNNIEIFESNIRLEERYLMERFVYGGIEFYGEENCQLDQVKKGYREFRNVKIKPSDYVPEFKVVSLDIECSEKGELYSIGFYASDTIPGNHSSYRKVIMIQPDKLFTKESEAEFIEWVHDEAELLRAFEKTIQHFDPDIIIGWNIINFDFRLLARRAELHHIKLKIGRDNSAMFWRNSRSENNQGYISIEGRMVIDGIAAMKAESYSFPSFSLEFIAQHFLGRGKATEDVENRLAIITEDFKSNKVKLAYYNLQDCILVWDIFAKIKLLDYLIFRSQLTGLELNRIGGSVAAFVNLYLPKLHRQGYISPNLPQDGGLASPGGYVMNSKPGLYKNVLVLDFKSLYPSIIRTFKIDPLGLIEGRKNPQKAIEGYRGGFFSRDKHLLPEIITDLWEKRDQAKKENDKARSQAIKIIMNSFYGVLGSGGCPFYDTRLASSITLRGHQIMQQTAKWIEQQGYQVIYGDTDSTFVLLNDDLTSKQANETGNSLAQMINRKWQQRLAEEHKIDCFLEIEFETHFSRFLMPTIRGSEHGSKKRYAGLLKLENEDKLVFKGLENVRTDWTELAKDFQLQLYTMIFHDIDPTDYILKTVQQTLSGERDAELVYRKRLRRNLQSYVKNVPPHVKAARIADAENLKRGKNLKHQNKGWISYIMTVNGPQPVDYLSAKIDYQFYVDRQIEPIADGILPFIGLSFKNIVDLQMGLF